MHSLCDNCNREWCTCEERLENEKSEKIGKGSWIKKKRNVEEGSEEYRDFEIKKKQCEAVIELLENLQYEVLNEETKDG
jgi:adenylate cyclase class IV